MVGVWRKDRFRKEQVQRGGWSSIQVYVKQETDGVPRGTESKYGGGNAWQFVITWLVRDV